MNKVVYAHKNRVMLGIAMLAALVAIVVGCSAASGATSRATEVKDIAGLTEGLRTRGATVETAGEIEQAFFSVQGQVFKVNGADVQAFEYESEADAETEAATVSPSGGSIGTTMVTWVGTPHFYRAGRLIVLYVGSEQSVIEALESLLGQPFAQGSA